MREAIQQHVASLLAHGEPVPQTHVVVADNEDDGETIVVTVYEPDPALWQPGLRRRRRP